MASLTDDNEAGGNLDKRNIWLIGVGHTSFAATLYIGDYKSSCLRPMRSEMYCTIWSLGISRGISSSE